MRIGEALGLRWSDVDLEDGILSIRQNIDAVGSAMVAGRPKKTSRSGRTDRSARTFALLPQAVEDLKRQRAHQRLRAGDTWQDQGLVFAADNGNPLRVSSIDRAFERVRERAGVRPLPLYSMQHASASILLAAGVPVAVAAKVMGHSVDRVRPKVVERGERPIGMLR